MCTWSPGHIQRSRKIGFFWFFCILMADFYFFPLCREAVACHNKFRRKCNSFFVEFVTTTVLGDRSTPSPEVITQLIQFVACKPSHPEQQAVKRGKGLTSLGPWTDLVLKKNNECHPSFLVYKSKSELSPFEECMDTSTTIKSSLLKLLLRHGLAWASSQPDHWAIWATWMLTSYVFFFLS